MCECMNPKTSPSSRHRPSIDNPQPVTPNTKHQRPSTKQINYLTRNQEPATRKQLTRNQQTLIRLSNPGTGSNVNSKSRRDNSSLTGNFTGFLRMLRLSVAPTELFFLLLSVQGLTTLAIGCRPYGAWMRNLNELRRNCDWVFVDVWMRLMIRKKPQNRKMPIFNWSIEDW